MKKYNDMPEFIQGGNPTEYKEWIAFLIDQIKLIKGESELTDRVPVSIKDVDNKGIENKSFNIAASAFTKRPDGLYQSSVVSHGMKSYSINTEVYSTETKQMMAFALDTVNDSSFRVVLYAPASILISVDK